MPSTSLWSLWDMLHFYAHKFVSLCSLLTSAEALFLKSEEILASDRNFLKNILVNGKPMMDDIGLRQSSKKALAIIEDCDKDYVSRRDLHYSLQALSELIKNELEDGYFLHLDPAEAELFEAKQPSFGNEVAAKFPSIAYEIDEAGKCSALGRSTASVFHLMRVMEIGIGAIRQSLGIPDPIKASDRNWGAILKKIKDDNKSGAWNPGDKQLLDESYASLDAVRLAWRNSTMHVENKYNPDEAQHIFAVVKGFMKKIASRMDENGVPLV